MKRCRWLLLNSSAHCVVSGEFEAVDAFAAKLKANGFEGKLLHTSHAFHSAMMNSILEEFEKKLGQVELCRPGLPYISNVSGDWINAEEAVDAGYWAKHLRSTVRFSDGLKKLFNIDDAFFVEVGPGKALTAFVKQHKDKKNRQTVVNLLRHPNEHEADDYHLLSKLGELWLYGVKIDWEQFHSREKRARVPLPSYPFERQFYWIEGNPFKMGEALFSQKKRLAEEVKKVEDFFYIPLWSPTVNGAFEEDEESTEAPWLLFVDDNGFGARIAEKLREKQAEVITVGRGSQYRKTGRWEYQISPERAGDYLTLLQKFRGSGIIPRLVVHLWNVTGGWQHPLNAEVIGSLQDLGFFSLVYLAQAIGKLNLTHDFYITVVSDQLQEVTGEEILSPGKATVLGPVKVIPQEFPNIRCRSIDIILPAPGTWQEDLLLENLLQEISSRGRDTMIAYRNNRRWVQTYEPVRLGDDKTGNSPAFLRTGGVYLLTGGLGKIGLLFARHLAETVHDARLILTGRSPFPPIQEWDEWLASHGPDDKISGKIRKLREIEAVGGEVMIERADVANLDQMQAVVRRVDERFGTLNGIIHAAGVTADNAAICAVEHISPKICEAQFHPKVYGLLVLDQVMKGRKLDFLQVTSSLSSVLGGLGFTCYSAANLFMDTFIKSYCRSHSSGWSSVNWDGWEFIITEDRGFVERRRCRHHHRKREKKPFNGY